MEEEERLKNFYEIDKNDEGYAITKLDYDPYKVRYYEPYEARLPQNLVNIWEDAFEYYPLPFLFVSSYSQVRLLINSGLKEEVFVCCGGYDDAFTFGQLKNIYEKFPNLFSPNEKGSCTFDNGFRLEGVGLCRFLDNNHFAVVSYIESAEESLIPQKVIIKESVERKIGLLPYVTNYVLEFPNGTSSNIKEHNDIRKIPVGEYNIEYMNIIVGGDNGSLLLPSNVRSIALCPYENKTRSIGSLSFSGNYTDFFMFPESLNILQLRINAPFKDVKYPPNYKVLLSYLDKQKKYEIIYAAPDYCMDSSSVPGYIKATAVGVNHYHRDDEIIEINTRYIVAVEKFDIKCYTPTSGSIIHMASNGIERHMDIEVYEPVNIIMDKIRQEYDKMERKTGGLAGLVNIIEGICSIDKNNLINETKN